MRTCAFCSNTGVTLEHVIAESVYKRMERTQEEIGVLSYTTSTGVVRRPFQKLNKFRVKRVCDKCNNGWMSALESWFLRHAGFLIEPAWPPLADENIKLLREDGKPLVRWMLKTAVVLDCLRLLKQVTPASLPEQVRENRMPGGVYLMLARIRNPTIDGRFEKGFRIRNGGEDHFNQEHKDGFSFAIQLNHLALRILVCPKAIVTFPFSKRMESFIPIYPKTRTPEGLSYTYESLADFYDRVYIETGRNH